MFFISTNNKKKIENTVRKLICQKSYEETGLMNLLVNYDNRKFGSPNIIGENNNYKKFFILSTQRSGSTFLVTMLQSHPNIVCYQELYMEDKCHFDYPLFPDGSNREILSIRNNSPREFLESFVYRNYTNDFKAVGFKMMYNQTLNNYVKPVWKILLKDKEIFVLHLTRKNYLNSLISIKINNFTHIANVRNYPIPIINDAEKQKKIKLKQMLNSFNINLDFTETENYFIKAEKDTLNYRLALKKHPVLEIFYEDLELNTHIESSKILSFLCLENKTLHGLTTKINDRKQSEIISNYEELKKLFLYSKWSEFFID